MRKNAAKKENGTKKIVKNYLLLLIIFIVCIGFVLYLCNLYQVYDQYQKETPVIQGALQEIVPDDLEHYVLDTPTTVIYMCTSYDEECRAFEKDFKKYLSKREWNNEVVYLNLNDLDQEEFVHSFNTKYPYKKESLSTHYPAFVLFEDGKVRGLLQGNNQKKLTITKVRQFLEINEIGE